MKNNIKSIKKKKGNKDVSIRIEEIENGFLIVKSWEWEDPKKGWQFENKTYYSKENPLDNIEFKDEDLTNAFD